MENICSSFWQVLGIWICSAWRQEEINATGSSQEIVHFERFVEFVSFANNISTVIAINGGPAPTPHENYEGVLQENVQADDTEPDSFLFY